MEPKRDAAHGRHGCERSGDVLRRRAEVSVPHQRVAVVFVQLMLVPASRGSVRPLSGSVRGSDLPAAVNETVRRELPMCEISNLLRMENRGWSDTKR